VLTRKHLKSLADALGIVLAERGLTALESERVAQEVIHRMRADGVVTPHFDRDRFSVAVFGAAQSVEILRNLAGAPVETLR
jgi:hypothetical protein